MRISAFIGRAAVALVVTLLFGRSTSSACVGSACLQIWSTADAAGALTVQWDPTEKVQTFQGFCTSDNSLCLYSTIDPGFMAPPADSDATDAYYVLKDNTTVTLEIVSADPGLSINVNGRKLSQAGETALLGTMPTIHVHPSWQIVVPGGQFGDYVVSYKLTTDSPLYTASQVLTLTVTNIQPTPDPSTPTPTPQVSPTPTIACVGDCDHNGSVTVDEVLTGVNMALAGEAVTACPALDTDHSNTISVDEILTAVNAVLNGCPKTPPVMFALLQQTIFTPSCATVNCHDGPSHTGNLVLVAGQAYGQLVNVEPDTALARQQGLLRVKPGAPDQSFLLIKLLGPPLGEGSRMPLIGNPMSPQQIQLIRDWILQGAQP